MAKKYNNSWAAKKLTVNFNQKQWRQDLADFISKKLFWYKVRVSRAKAISKNFKDKGIKEFEVYDGYGRKISVRYCEERKVLNSSNAALIQEYLSVRETK